ncbi:MAG: GNAT family N-acetyltransferase [Candidatus Bathyarchaeota archaeon]|nr:MAG: GNAT family N-acetyltransferase [Candidatus Bathyarchaeota archaeon]
MLMAKVLDRIDSIGKLRADALGKSFFFSYSWFKTIEETRAFQVVPKYIAIYDENCLVAIAPCFIESTSQYQTVEDFLFPRSRKVGKLRHVFHGFVNPSLSCYSPSSFQSQIMKNPCFSSSEIFELVLNMIDQLCKTERIMFSSFKFVSQFDEFLLKSLEDVGYFRSFLKSNMYIEPVWDSFDDYLKSVKNSDVRRKIRKEIRTNRKAGIRIEELKIDSLVNTIPKLYDNLYMKYNRKPSPLTSAFFATLAHYSPNRTRVFAAKKNDRVVGFSLFLEHQHVWDCYIVGFDYKNLGNNYTYFNLVFYAPIEKALQEDVKRINFRPGTFEAKRRRGCKPEKLFFFIKCQNRLLAPLVSKSLRMIGARLGVPYRSH